MFKKLVTIIVAFTLAISTSGSAFANFADLRLIRVYYDRAGAEIATDLGLITDLVNSAIPTSTPTRTIAGSFGSLTTGYAVYFALDRANFDLWASNSTTAAPLVIGQSSGLTAINAGTTNMYSTYNLQGGTDYTGLASHTNSFKNKLSSTPGFLGNTITGVAARAATELNLANLSTNNTQILYYWNNAKAATAEIIGRTGVAVATITTNADGSTVISAPPPTSTVTVTAGAGGTLNVNTPSPRTVTQNFTTPFTFNADAGYYISGVSGCGGTYSNLNHTITTYTFTTGPITANCTVNAVFAASTPQTIGTIIFNPATLAVDGTTTVNATASSGFPVIFTSDTPGVCTVSNSTVTGATIGTCTIKADQPGNATFAAASVTQDITVTAAGLASQIITFGGVPTVNVGGSGTVSATGGTSGNEVTFTAEPPSVCTIIGSTVTGSGAGTCTVTANQAGNATFSAATPVTQDITVAAAELVSQTITFTPPATATYGDTPVTLSATASSGLPVSLELVSGPATFSNNILTITGAGDIIVKASQAGSSSYSAATDVQRTITVGTKPLTVTAANATRAYGVANPVAPGFTTAPALVGSDTISSVTHNYAATADATAAVGTTHSITPSAATFSNGTAANYTITYAPGTLTIAGQASQTITFAPALTATYGDAAVTLTATASSGLPVNFSLVSGPATLNGNTLTITGAGSIIVKVSQAGTNNYSAAIDVEKTITVAAKALTVTATNANRAFGATNPAEPGFTAPALVGSDTISSVTYTYAATADPTATVGTTHNITPSLAVFSNGSAANYTITYAPGTLTIAGLASQTITFAPPATAIYGDAPITLTATASSGLPVSYSLVSGPATLSGNVLTITGAGSIIVKATQAGTSNYSAATDVEKTITIAAKALTVTAANASRVFGAANPVTPGFTAPALVGSDAISTVTYTYAATADTAAALNTTHSITPSAALFSSGSAANYTITYAIGTLTIAGKASQSISFAPPATATFGDAPVTLNATASSSLPVSFSLVSGPATLSSNTLTITGAGSIVVKASQAGTSNYSAATDVQKTITVAAVAPGAPTAVTATVGIAEATVTFTAPTSTGGSTITGYTVTSTPGSLIGAGPAGAITVSGLTNGTAYTFTVTATNAIGTSPASVKSNSVTPAFPPIMFTIFPTFGANGSIDPASNQTVEAGKNASFTVTPNSGYQISAVTGCGGTLSGTTFTTAGIIRDCSVSATFVAIPKVKGDLNGKDGVNIADALLALQFAIGLKTPTPEQIAAAPIGAINGKIDIADAVAILNYANSPNPHW